MSIRTRSRDWCALRNRLRHISCFKRIDRVKVRIEHSRAARCRRLAQGSRTEAREAILELYRKAAPFSLQRIICTLFWLPLGRLAMLIRPADGRFVTAQLRFRLDAFLLLLLQLHLVCLLSATSTF